MRRLSKLGAGALALMLSATLVLPITANAAQSRDWYASGGSVIDSNTKTYRFSGSAVKATTTTTTTDDDDDYDYYDYTTQKNAELNAWNQALAQGVVKAGTFAKFDHSVQVYDTAAGKYVTYYFQYADDGGWDYSNDDEWSGTTYTYYLTITQTSYKHNVTGETSTKYSDLTGVNLVDVNTIPKKATVYTGAYQDIMLNLRAGNIKIKNVKSSNKKAVQARVINSVTNKTSENYELSKDLKGYYYTVNGEDFYVQPGTKVNKSNATVDLRVFAKKAGKSVISFDIEDINGNKTGSAKITVVSSKTKPIASITFGGKSLDQGDVIGSSNSKYIYNKQDLNAFSGYTTAKSGKLKVTTSDGYKLVRIQVGTLEKFKYDSSQDPSKANSNYSTGGTNYTYSKTIETTERHPVDLNKDGDYDDVVDGVSEDAVTFRYKTVGNNKKITLSKTSHYTKTTTSTSTSVINNPEANKSSEVVTGATDGSALAPTSIKVTVYNKSAKEYVDVYYTIYKKVKKF